MTGRPLISLRDVRKSYGNYFELGLLELEVQAGCVVAIVGPNGSGKSTLFGMLMNLIQPDSGEVWHCPAFADRSELSDQVR